MALSLKGAIQGMADINKVTVEQGTVLSLEPISIVNSREAGVYLSDYSLIIPSGKAGLLEVGKEFYFLLVNGGKAYYLLDEV